MQATGSKKVRNLRDPKDKSIGSINEISAQSARAPNRTASPRIEAASSTRVLFNSYHSRDLIRDAPGIYLCVQARRIPNVVCLGT